MLVNKRWRISSDGFVWWFTDNVVNQTLNTIKWEEWLEQRQYEGLLTKGEKENLSQLAKKIPQGAVSGTANLIKVFFKGLLTSGTG